MAKYRIIQKGSLYKLQRKPHLFACWEETRHQYTGNVIWENIEDVCKRAGILMSPEIVHNVKYICEEAVSSKK